MTGNHWWEPLTAWHAMLFSSVAAEPHLLSDTSRTVGLWLFICLEGLADIFPYLKSVSYTSLFNIHVIAFLNCTEVTVLAVFKGWDERDECVFEKKINLSVGHLPKNFENNDTGSELTEQQMQLEQTAHMLVFCRQTHALKAIYLSLDGLGSSVMGVLWRKTKHHTLKHEDKWRSLLQTLWVWMCVITIRKFLTQLRFFSACDIHV